MTERLFALAAATSIIGLIILSYASSHIYPPKTRLEDVSMDFLDENIHLEAPACSVHRFDGGSILVTLCREGEELDLYIPYNTAQNLDSSLLENQTLDVVGTVQVYQGRLEVVLDNIEDLKIK